MSSNFLLSGLLRCGQCGRPYVGTQAKSGQFSYYVCGKLSQEGASTCKSRYLNAPGMEDYIVGKIRERILNEETIVDLVKLVTEEFDEMVRELADRIDTIAAELAYVDKRLDRLYEAIETSELTLEALSSRILKLRHWEEQLMAAKEEAERQLAQRRVGGPPANVVRRYVADFREFLQDGTIPERKALIRNFGKGIEVKGDEVTLSYTVPMPSDAAIREPSSVLQFVLDTNLA